MALDLYVCRLCYIFSCDKAEYITFGSANEHFACDVYLGFCPFFLCAFTDAVTPLLVLLVHFCVTIQSICSSTNCEFNSTLKSLRIRLSLFVLSQTLMQYR